MATITSPGVGSGLDVNGIVSQLVALERKPIEKLEEAASTIQTRISSYGRVQSLFSTLRDAAAALGRTTQWQQTTATASDATALSVSASSGASVGSYGVTVSSLARSQNLASTAFAAGSTVVGGGTLQIELGSWNGGSTTFTPKAGATPVSVTVPADATLQQVRDAINGANAGVSAAIVTDASGARLTLRSRESGLSNSMRITATDGNGAPLTTGLGTLGYNPPGGATAMSQTQAAANAAATINGLAVSSESNTLSGVLDGASITLLRETGATPVSVSVTSDRTAMKTAIQAFATAYNALNSYLAEQTKYDESTKTAGALQGDSAALGMRSQMRTLLRAQSGASTTLTSLSAVGFNVQRDGSISIDNAKLEAGLDQLPELARLFSNGDANVPANVGFGERFRTMIDQIVGSTGTLTTRSDGLKASLKRNEKDQEKLEERVLRVQTRLLKQYSALDTQMGQLNSLSNYVSSQVAQWNKKTT